MRIRQTLAIAVFTAAIGGLIVPALAEGRSGAGSVPDQGMTMDMGRAGHGMMGHGMMSGCGDMMQSMNGGDSRPNSQWQTHRPGDATPD